MKTEELDRAEDTESMLQHASLSGVPIIIPGALQRANACTPRPASPVAAAPIAPPMSTGVIDRGRLEYERTGGGAPSERTGVTTAFTKLWRWIFVPA